MNIVQTLRIGALACNIALLCGSVHAQQALAPQSGDHSVVWKIAFDRTRFRSTSNFEAMLTDIYVIDSDGSNEKKLTASGLCHLPNWTPDGLNIMFLCLKDEPESAARPDLEGPDQDIGIAESRGTAPRFLSPGVRILGEPSWLPDGKTLAIGSVRHGKLGNKFGAAERSIYTIGLNAGELPHLFLKDVAEVQWSPDGRRIAYVAYRGNKSNPALYLADANGSGEQPLTAQKMRAYSPSWSPDSRTIAFTEWRGNHRIISLATPPGTQTKELTPRSIDAFVAKWSPDGSRLVFSAFRDERLQIFLVNADGTGLRQLTNDTKTKCDHPSWSSDSSRVIAECGFAGFYDRSLLRTISPILLDPSILVLPIATKLYLFNVNAADTVPIQLTNVGGSNPRFCPVTDQSKVVATN